jgi:hypothetical protein
MSRLLGVMNIGSFGQRTISPEDERLLITIGVHMGAVLENIYCSRRCPGLE